MRRNLAEFIRRGLVACGFGPIVLALVYTVLYRRGLIETLSVPELCTGIISLAALAFMAGGTNVVYQIERLPLALAILIHGGVLYISYLAVYLINGWLRWGRGPIMIFTGIFVGGYILIWAIIYAVNRRKTARLNKILQETQRGA